MRPAHQRRPRLRLLLPVVALLASGCGDGDGAAGVEPTVRDSAGVTIVENPAGAVEAAPVWRLSDEPLVDIGALEGPEEQQLSSVSDVVALSDGTLAVAQLDPPEVRLYAPDGSHVRTVGGEGEGPGEFQSPTRMTALPGDTLLVHDWRLNRTSRFAPDGSFLGSVRLQSDAPVVPVGRLADGTLVAEPMSMFGARGLPSQGTQRLESPLLAYGPDGALRDTLLVRQGEEFYVSRSGERFMVSSVLFGTGPHEVVAPDALYTGHSRVWQFRVRDPGGDVRRVVRLDRERRPVTETVRDSVIEERLEGAEEAGFGKQQEAVYREMPIPDRQPAFDAFRLDDGGNLWVREPGLTGGGRARWIVFGPGGRVRAVALLPAGLAVLAIGRDRVAGRWTDELDVQHVRVYRLERDAPDSPE